MSFAAKFGGTCSKCAGRIPAGSSVNYDGKAIRHAPRCPAKGTVTEVPAPAPRQDESLTEDSKVLGRATYKGKSGYLVLWHGITKEGKRATKLAFRDGTKTFWGNGDVQIEKMYDEPITFGRLNELAAEFKAERATEKVETAKSGAMTEERIIEIAAGCGSTPVVPAVTKSFTRDGKASVTVGERTTWTAKDKSIHHGIVVSVGRSYYHSEDECEDMDCFCRNYGHRTPYTVREIAATPEQLASEARKAADAEERKTLETAIRASYGVGPNPAPGSTGWDRPTCHLTDIWSESRAAGSEHWYLGADGVVYHMRSDYDMGPSWWRTTATVEMIERAKAVGMKAVY